MTNAIRKDRTYRAPALIVEAMRTVLEYLWEDEHRHFEECEQEGRPMNHVFPALQRIRIWIRFVEMQSNIDVPRK